MADLEKEVIVVVEDSPPNRNILTHLLKKLNFEVIEFENGQDAWNGLEQAKKEGKTISAIISDIMMPIMDGLELLTKVRDDEHYGPIPFVIVTAISDKDHLLQAMNKKVNGYILKPVTFQRVSKKVQEIFPNKKIPKIAS
jgi:two-component system chemotaxis response regulator CheY